MGAVCVGNEVEEKYIEEFRGKSSKNDKTLKT
jgi:hypothetical protein